MPTSKAKKKPARKLTPQIEKALQLISQRPGITGQQILMNIGENTFTESGKVAAEAERFLLALKRLNDYCKVIKSGLTGAGGIISDGFYPADWEPKKRSPKKADQGLTVYYGSPQPYEPPKDVQIAKMHRAQQVRQYQKRDDSEKIVVTPKAKVVTPKAKPAPKESVRQLAIAAIEDLKRSGDPISLATVAAKIGCKESDFHQPHLKPVGKMIAKAIVAQFS
jgi:hypothetical protein